MIEILQSYDSQAMLLLNAPEHHTAFADFFFWMVSRISIWIPTFLVFIYTIIRSKGKESTIIIASVLLMFVLCDQVSASLLKPLFERPRPSHAPAIMEQLSYVYNYHGGAYGFPSSHACNSFGFALLSALLFRQRGYTICVMLWALLCCYSRIYLGVHYPGDILFGSLLGLLIGAFCYWLYLLIQKRTPGIIAHWSDSREFTPSGYRKKDVTLTIIVLCTSVFCILSCAEGLK